MEKWRLFWETSEKNIALARFLSQLTSPNLLGLATYHAQQGLEMALKACIFKFGFEEYMRIKRISDNTSTIEFETTNLSERRPPTMHHFPLKEMIIPALDFIEDEVKKITPEPKEEKSNRSELLKAIENMMVSVKDLRDFISYVDSRRSKTGANHVADPKEELWKFSMGLQVDDERMRDYFMKMREAAEGGAIVEFNDSALRFIRGLFHDIYWRLKKAHNLRARNEFEERAIRTLEKAQLPVTLFYQFKEIDDRAYKRGIDELLTEDDPLQIMVRLLDPDGILNDVEKMRYNTRVAKIGPKRMFFSRFRRNINWMLFIVAASYVMLFAFPHEEMGRYQRIVDGTPTEELYLKHRIEVDRLISQCSKSCTLLQLVLKI